MAPAIQIALFSLREPRTHLTRAKLNSFSYSSYDPDVPLSVPFHTDCFEIFARALTYSLKGKVSSGVDLSIVDKDLLFAAMAKLHKGYAHVLSLSYGELQRSAREQYWGNNTGYEV